jgi:cysteine desulfurase
MRHTPPPQVSPELFLVCVASAYQHRYGGPVPMTPAGLLRLADRHLDRLPGGRACLDDVPRIGDPLLRPYPDRVLGYLDSAATTPMRPEAVEAMLPFLSERFANPSGAHLLARDARRAIDEARDVVAEVLGAEPGEVVFTSGGTEADNLAVLGRHDLRGGVVVCSAIEHHAVLDPVESRRGRVIAVDGGGAIDLAALEAAVDTDTTLVSVMLANNEIGTIQPLTDVARIVRERAPNAALHTDAVQGFSWLDVAELCAPADLVSISAHKFGGPKGAGALVMRNGVELAARQLGGGQERDRRSGTHNVAAIVAMAAAARATAATRDRTVAVMGEQRDRLARGLVDAVPGTVITAAASPKTAGICHVCIDGVESEALLYLLGSAGFASAASSCSSGAMETSHVLWRWACPRTGQGFVAAVARLRQHGRRCRSRTRGGSGCGRATAGLRTDRIRTMRCWPPCRAAWIRRWPRPAARRRSRGGGDHEALGDSDTGAARCPTSTARGGNNSASIIWCSTSDDFARDVVGPYVTAPRRSHTEPCTSAIDISSSIVCGARRPWNSTRGHRPSRSGGG